MATSPATAALQVDINDSIDGVRNAIRGLSLGMWKMHKGLTSSLRSEFSAQNKLLGWQGKNLQLIAQAITKTSAALIKQQADQFRAQQETMKEASRTKGDAGGVKSTDKSIQLDISDLGSISGIAAALSGLAIGFLAQISAPVMALAESIKGGLVKIGSAFKKSKSVMWITNQAKIFWWHIRMGTAIIQNKFRAFRNTVAGFFKKPFVTNKLILGIRNAVLGPWKLLAKGPVALFKTIAADVRAFMGMFKGSGTGFLGKLKNFFTNFKAMFSMKGGWIDDVMKAVTKFKGVFQFFMKIGRFLGKAFVIFQVITAMFDFWGGFVETEGNLVAKIAGGLGAAIKGFFGGFLDIGIMIEDGIKWIITKIAGFLGFDESAVEGAIGGFTIFGTIKDVLFGAIDYLTGLFKFEDTSFAGIAKSLFDIIFAPLNLAIDFLLDLFGWKSDPEKDFKLSTFVVESFDKAVAWVTEFLSFSVDAIASGWTSLTSFVSEKWEIVKGWFTSLLSWGKGVAAEGGSWVMTTIDNIVTTVKTWFSNLFSWASTEDDKDSFIIKTIKNVVKTVKEWFGSMFKFDSTSDLLSTGLNIMMWIPNLITKAIASVTAWFAGILGFKEESEAIAKAGKEFNIGDLIMSMIDKIMKWLGDIFDLDFGKIFKDAIGAVGEVGSKVLGWLGWGGDKEAEPNSHGGGLVTKGGSVSVAAGEVIANAQQGRQLTQLMQEKQGLEGQGRGPVIINNTSNIQQNSKTDLALPTLPVSPSNGNNPAQVYN